MIISYNMQICDLFFFQKVLEIIVTSLNFYYNEKSILTRMSRDFGKKNAKTPRGILPSE